MNAKLGLNHNVEYVHLDANGNVKPIFTPNPFARFLMKIGLITPHHRKIGIFGSWGDQMALHNLVVDAGKAAVAGLINGVVTNFFEHIGVGTGTTAPAAGDTALETEITDSGMARVAGATSRSTTDVTDDTAEVTTTFSVTGTKAVTEAGLLDSVSSGVLLARQTFSAINVVNGDSLQITWKIDVD